MMCLFYKNSDGHWDINNDGGGRAFYKFGNLIFEPDMTRDGEFNILTIYTIDPLDALDHDGNKIDAWRSNGVFAEISDVDDFCKSFPAFCFDERAVLTKDIIQEFKNEYEKAKSLQD